MLSIALNKTGDRETAKELVQEGFIDLYLHKTALDESTSVRAYLYVILKNKIISHYRKEVSYQKYTDFIQHQPVVSPLSPAVYVETRELEKQLRHEIEKLPPQCRQVFKLSREQYLTDKQIAEELNLSVNTVEQHKRRALRILRTSLGDFLEISVLLYLLK